jgi:hypothetical protein
MMKSSAAWLFADGVGELLGAEHGFKAGEGDVRGDQEDS